MSRLRRAITESRQALGFNIPTALTVVLGIGLSAIVVPRFSRPAAASSTEFVLWLLESVIWIVSLAIVFVPLLVWKYIKIVRHDRSKDAHLKMVLDSDAATDDEMKSFLHKTLSDSHYGVARCYLFGSVVRDYPTRDVDVVVQFDSDEEKEIRAYRRRLRKAENDFMEVYGLMIHMQTFLSSEDAAVQTFLHKAGKYESLIER